MFLWHGFWSDHCIWRRGKSSSHPLLHTQNTCTWKHGHVCTRSQEAPGDFRRIIWMIAWFSYYFSRWIKFLRTSVVQGLGSSQKLLKLGMVTCFLGGAPIICSNCVSYSNAEKSFLMALKSKTEIWRIVITVNAWLLLLCTFWKEGLSLKFVDMAFAMWLV